jgi:O-methyltransferase involved in polyketide biosynthesis
VTEPARDYTTISPSARSLLLVRAETDLPFAREAAELLFGADAVAAAAREATDTPGADLRRRHFEHRARTVDAALRAEGALRVVELAAGLSFRGLSLAADPAVHYLDTDLPAMVAIKNDLVAHLAARHGPAAGTLRVEPLDALDARAVEAAVASVPDGPFAFVQEGLLVYLDAGEKARLAASLRAALVRRGGVWITGDVYVRGQEARFFREERTKAFLEAHRVDENKFASLSAAEAFFAGVGFRVARRPDAHDDPWGVRQTWVLVPA